MYRLRIDKLWKIAAEHGDTTRVAIHRRTGIAESSVYRILSGTSQPDLNSALRIAEAYGVRVEELMERTAPTGAESVPA
uniref:helix-turn-helix domain-containing protein n=1 Tax=Streptomyces sp. NBC_01177 TaxID=2903761 RepID=UPI002F90AE2A|nr:helix-turn-helix transcriptional regulator [Streptomyces sp. NBC_01177]